MASAVPKIRFYTLSSVHLVNLYVVGGASGPVSDEAHRYKEFRDEVGLVRVDTKWS